ERRGGDGPREENSAHARHDGCRATRPRSTMLVRQMVAVRKHTEQLLQQNQRLRQELSSLYLASASIRVRASRVVSLARFASPAGETEIYRAANKPRRPYPHLVLLPGRE